MGLCDNAFSVLIVQDGGDARDGAEADFAFTDELIQDGVLPAGAHDLDAFRTRAFAIAQGLVQIGKEGGVAFSQMQPALFNLGEVLQPLGLQRSLFTAQVFEFKNQSVVVHKPNDNTAFIDVILRSKGAEIGSLSERRVPRSCVKYAKHSGPLNA